VSEPSGLHHEEHEGWLFTMKGTNAVNLLGGTPNVDYVRQSAYGPPAPWRRGRQATEFFEPRMYLV